MGFVANFLRQWAFALGAVGVYRRWIVCFLLPLGLFATFFMGAGVQMKAVFSSPLPAEPRLVEVQRKDMQSKQVIAKNLPNLNQELNLDTLNKQLIADSFQILAIYPPLYDSLKLAENSPKVEIWTQPQLNMEEIKFLTLYLQKVDYQRLNAINSNIKIQPLDIELKGRGEALGLKKAIAIFIQILSALLGLLLVFSAMWGSKYLAMHQFVDEFRDKDKVTETQKGLFLSKFITLFFVNNVALFLTLLGLWISLKLSYNSDSQMLVDMIANLLTINNLACIFLAAAGATLPILAVWTRLFAWTKRAYWAGRWANFFYILWAAVAVLGLLLLANQNKMMAFIPVVNLLAFINYILSNVGNASLLITGILSSVALSGLIFWRVSKAV